jgi:hypothetical protein
MKLRNAIIMSGMFWSLAFLVYAGREVRILLDEPISENRNAFTSALEGIGVTPVVYEKKDKDPFFTSKQKVRVLDDDEVAQSLEKSDKFIPIRYISTGPKSVESVEEKSIKKPVLTKSIEQEGPRFIGKMPELYAAIVGDLEFTKEYGAAVQAELEKIGVKLVYDEYAPVAVQNGETVDWRKKPEVVLFFVGRSTYRMPDEYMKDMIYYSNASTTKSALYIFKTFGEPKYAGLVDYTGRFVPMHGSGKTQSGIDPSDFPSGYHWGDDSKQYPMDYYMIVYQGHLAMKNKYTQSELARLAKDLKEQLIEKR